jgi:hypothetical protein
MKKIEKCNNHSDGPKPLVDEQIKGKVDVGTSHYLEGIMCTELKIFHWQLKILPF